MAKRKRKKSSKKCGHPGLKRTKTGCALKQGYKWGKKPKGGGKRKPVKAKKKR